MLAHNINGKHLASCSDLLLGAQILERWAEARDPLLPKTTTTGRLNIICSQSTGNLFSSQMMKGSCTLTTQSATVESNEAEEDSGTNAEEEEKAKSSAEEDGGTSSEVGGVDQSVRYIVNFTNVVELHQRKKQNCLRCSSSDHLMKDCQKDLSKTT